MRITVWFAGFSLFLLGSIVLHLRTPTARVPVAHAAAAEPDADPRVPVRALFDAIEGALTTRKAAVARKVEEIETSDLEGLLRGAEMGGGAQRGLDERIAAELDRFLRGARGDGQAGDAGWIDFLVLVSLDERVFRAAADDGRSSALPEEARRRLVEICQPYFRRRETIPGVDRLPVALGPVGVSGPAGAEASLPGVFFVAARTVWTRPDLPHSVLLAGQALDRVLPELEGLEPSRRAGLWRLEWHFLDIDGEGRPTVVAGERRGSGLRLSLLEAISTGDATEESAFVGGEGSESEAAGRWSGLLSPARQLVVGWGVTAHRAGATPASSDDPGSEPNTGSGLSDQAITEGLLVAGAVFAGLLLLWVVFRLGAGLLRLVGERTHRSRLSRDWDEEDEEDDDERASPSAVYAPGVLASMEPGGPSEPGARRRPGGDEGDPSASPDGPGAALEIRRLPVEIGSVVRAEIARVTGGVDEIRREVSESRETLRDLADAVPEERRDVLDHLEGLATRFDSFQEQFSSISQAVEAVSRDRDRADGEAERAQVDSEIRALRERWNEKVREFRSEVDEALALGVRLVADLESAKQVEESLQAENLRRRRRERQLAKQLKAVRGELEEHEQKLDEARRELGSAREEAERVAAEGLTARARIEELEEREVPREERSVALEKELSGLREECDALRQRTARAVENEERVLELSHVVEELEQELRALRARAADTSDAEAPDSETPSEEGAGSPAFDVVASFHDAVISGHLPVALLAVDADLRVFVFNPTAETVWGVAAADVLGLQLEESPLGAAPGGSELLVEVGETLRSGAPREAQLVAGRRAWLEPIRGEGDRPAGALVAFGTAPDPAGDREGETSGDWARSLLLSLPMALVLTDASGRIVSWNPRASDVLGVPESRAIGQPLSEVETALADTTFSRKLAEAQQRGRPTRFSLQTLERGAQVSYVVTWAPLRRAGEERDLPSGGLILLERSVRKESVS